MSEGILGAFLRRGVELLCQEDPVLYDLLEAEYIVKQACLPWLHRAALLTRLSSLAKA